MKKYLDIAIANEQIKTTDIKGKDYAEVNQRIKAFRMVYPQGSIPTEIVSIENGVVIMKASVFTDEGKLLATGTAYEKEDSTFINKTSYIENCETSAIGRALGISGFGIDVSVASAEEVQNAINNQIVTQEEADNYKLTFGKFKGMTFKEIQKEKPEYLNWLLENSNDENIKKMIELSTGKKPLSKEEQIETLNKLQELNDLMNKYAVDRDALYKHYKVRNNSQMNLEQLNDAIKVIKEKYEVK